MTNTSKNQAGTDELTPQADTRESAVNTDGPTSQTGTALL